jgi:hypothetical protein
LVQLFFVPHLAVLHLLTHLLTVYYSRLTFPPSYCHHPRPLRTFYVLVSFFSCSFFIQLFRDDL